MYVVHKNLSPEINQKFITLKLFRVRVEFFQKDLRNKENLSQFTLIVGLEGNNVLHSTGDPWVFSTIFCNFLNFCLLCAKKEIDVKSRITYAQVQKEIRHILALGMSVTWSTNLASWPRPKKNRKKYSRTSCGGQNYL